MNTYLIWSNEHRAWWRHHAKGYTNQLEKAGRYSRDEALKHSRSRDQEPGQPLPELPIREADVLDVLVDGTSIKTSPGGDHEIP